MNYDNNNFTKGDLIVLFVSIVKIMNCIDNFCRMQSYLQIIILISMFVVCLYIKTN